jgi:TonB family protein
MKASINSLGICLLITSLIAAALAQSGSRAGGRPYGVNLTYAVYQYDAVRSPSLEEVTRLTSTFSTPQEEIAHLKEKYRLEEVEVRHIRSVGLKSEEMFNDAVLLGPEYMVFWITPREVARGYMKLDLKVRYANDPLLNASGVEFDNFETVAIRGGRGMFGIKYFVGAGGRQESAPIERTLLVSVTPEIVPLASLRNRPEDLSRPVDEYGSPLQTKEGDRFTPPVALDRVVPKFDTGRGVNGSVTLAGIVTPEGKIINVRVLRSIDPIIDDRAIEAFRKYRFSPALLNGKPVYATWREEITFAPGPPSILDIQREIEEQRRIEKEKRRKPIMNGQDLQD